ncbi:MAG TPA: hypothetical protein VGE01_09625 [Fimbriimonas sp.]
MINHVVAARLTTLLAAAVWSGSTIPSYSEEPAPAPQVSEFLAVGTGSPKESLCGPEQATEPCVAVPVFIKGVAPDGTEQRLTVDYRVGSNLIQSVKADFGETTPVVLRNLKKALEVGAKDPAPAVKVASRTVLPSVAARIPYHLNPGVKMPLGVEAKVAALAHATRERTGKKITITSGTRNAVRQAAAMRTKIALGENLTKLYANKTAVKEVIYAYEQAKAAGYGKEDVTNAMAQVIEQQVDQGVYLSNHLKEGAVDIRTRDLSYREKLAILQTVKQIPGMRALDESTPPHIHLDVL